MQNFIKKLTLLFIKLPIKKSIIAKIKVETMSKEKEVRITTSRNQIIYYIKIYYK